MRQGAVYYGNVRAGIITETDEGQFIFRYDENFIKQFPDDFITFTMPVREQPYEANHLFPFFEGLIPEGWLLDIATKSWKINQNDRMGLLLVCCQDCIGAVSVRQLGKDNEE